MKLVNVGFGNMVAAARLVAIVSPDSARRYGAWCRMPGKRPGY